MKLLTEWNSKSQKDPELFICYFNYYIKNGQKEVVALDGQQTADGFKVTDSAGATFGYLHSAINYNSAYLDRAFSYIDTGIKLYPARLDMRFGKIYMLGELKEYTLFANEIIAVIDYSEGIKNKWQWKDNKPLENAKVFFLNGMQDYITTLYNSGDAQLPLVRNVANEILKYYPDHVEALSDLAITYLLTDDYDKGLQYLLKAESIKPDDAIVLNNIAETFSRKKDKKNAILYYNKIIKVGDEESGKYAKEKIKALN